MEWAEREAATICAQYAPPDTGRWSSIGDQEVVSRLLGAIYAGNYAETACDFAGIARSTLSNWTQRGEAGEQPYADFLKALKRAEAISEIAAVDAVRGHWRREWASAMTYLERRKPERWGKRDADGAGGPRLVVQIGVKDSDVQISTLSPVPRNELRAENHG